METLWWDDGLEGGEYDGLDIRVVVVDYGVEDVAGMIVVVFLLILIF